MDEDVATSQEEPAQDVDNVCRLCLSREPPIAPIFGVDDSDLSQKIYNCLSIRVTSNDKVSKNICDKCTTSVNDWHKYKDSCLKSQETLSSWLKSQSKDDEEVVEGDGEASKSDETTDQSKQLPETSKNDDVTAESDEAQDVEMCDTQSTTSSVEAVAVHKPQEEIHMIIDSSDDEEESPSKPAEITEETSNEKTDETTPATTTIKSEPLDDENNVMEADSTQKSTTGSVVRPKRKVFRGPKTHFRGVRVYKQKCPHCQINLHSKFSYAKHMERFHSGNARPARSRVKVNNNTTGEDFEEGEEESIEDIEDELISMEKNAPLTPVQQSIISQLKTFSCYSCQEVFPDYRTTLAHLRTHMPDLRPHTCIACLQEFPGRVEFKTHYNSSFQCAMKIALVVPKQGVEKHFTCNMCLKIMSNRQELLGHLNHHSETQYEQLVAPPAPQKQQSVTPKQQSVKHPRIPNNGVLRAPYMSGDPFYNNPCDLCGMIYKNKPNLIKHRVLCSALDPAERISYRCVDCGMTFLVYKKYLHHMIADHHKRVYGCCICFIKFKDPNEFLSHYVAHKLDSRFAAAVANCVRQFAVTPGRSVNLAKFNCNQCGLSFGNLSELNDHKNLHVKLKIYTCAICQLKFGTSADLDIHMRSHDASEMNGSSSFSQQQPTTNACECPHCHKVFSTPQNMRRHEKSAHIPGANVATFKCTECPKVFNNKDNFEAHMRSSHKQSKLTLSCPLCPKTFVFDGSLRDHMKRLHSSSEPATTTTRGGGGPTMRNGLHECEVCHKCFAEPLPLKIHRAWHVRRENQAKRLMNSSLNVVTTSRGSSGNSSSRNLNASLDSALMATTMDKRPTARKSFPNRPSPMMMQQQSTSQRQQQGGSLQCQVCDDRFYDVGELRSHLWEVHCARNKPERNLTTKDFQCELCTNVFADEQELAEHMQWHNDNPILGEPSSSSTSSGESLACDICGRVYSNRKTLMNHKKLHKATAAATVNYQLLRKPTLGKNACTTCHKVFATKQTMRRHRINVHRDPIAMEEQARVSKSNSNSNDTMEHDSKAGLLQSLVQAKGGQSSSVNHNKKFLNCQICKQQFVGMAALYRHQQAVHKSNPLNKLCTSPYTERFVPVPMANGGVSCNLCHKSFMTMPRLKQHFTIKHKNRRGEANKQQQTFQTQKKYHHPSIPSRQQQQQPVASSSGQSFASSRNASAASRVTASTKGGGRQVLYFCRMCDRTSFNIHDINNHIYAAHRAAVESRTNKDSLYLPVHLDRYEIPGSYGTTCPKCVIRYPNVKALKIHYLKIHDTSYFDNN